MLTPDDRPTVSMGTPAVNLFNWLSFILSSVFTFAVCPLMPLTRPCDKGFSTPFALLDCFDFFPGGCLPVLLPGIDRAPLMIRAARGLSSSSSSSLLLPSSSLKEDKDARRFFAVCGGRSLNTEESGDAAMLCLSPADKLSSNSKTVKLTHLVRNFEERYLQWSPKKGGVPSACEERGYPRLCTRNLRDDRNPFIGVFNGQNISHKHSNLTYKIFA